MSFDYSDILATAQDLIPEFGTTATLRTPGATTGDPWAPTAGTASDTTVKVLFEEWTAAERAGGLVEMGDRKVMVSTQGVSTAPTTADKLVHGGTSYEIVNVMQAAPAGDALFYTLQVRA